MWRLQHGVGAIAASRATDYLTEVYLTKPRYCLVSISKHYAERTWTDRVERAAAQARAIRHWNATSSRCGWTMQAYPGFSIPLPKFATRRPSG
jgi:hypothetical protein